jgi:hypothetical protein
MSIDGPALKDAGADGIRRLWMDNFAQMVLLRSSTALYLAALIVFVALARRLIRETGAGDVAGDILLGGAVVMIVQGLVFAAVTAAAYVAASGGSGGLADLPDWAVQSLYAAGAIANGVGDMAIVGHGLFVAALCVAGLRGGFLSRPIAWIGLVIAAMALVCPVVALAVPPVALVLFEVGNFGSFLWLLLVAIDLLVRGIRGRGHPGASPRSPVPG